MTVTSIGGEGVRLRGLVPADIDDLLAGYADPQVQRFLPGLPATREQAERHLGDSAGGLFAIAGPGTDRLLGTIGLTHLLPERGQGELVCWVGPWARRRGVATAAVRALSGHAFDRGVTRVELLAHWANTAGQRLALAAGFQREGVRRGAAPDRDDLVAYARLADDPVGPVERLLPDLPGGELTDGVVTVRPLVAGDLDFYAELHSQADVVATSVPPVAPSREQLVRRCGRAPAEWLAGGRADMVIVDAATGTPAGDIGLYYDEPRTGQAMIGYSMLPGWRGRGFPTRAVQLVTLWAFAETGIARLVAGALPSNVGSHRVLEKAGFKREAYLRSRLPGDGGRRYDDVQFVLLAEDLLTEVARLDG
jgi:RimJ/RimL family protein N-acetyltransferase